MTASIDVLDKLKTLNVTAPFNCWMGLEVVSAGQGAVEIRMPWRDEASQYSGFLHAGVIGALVDTACGYAASTLVRPVLASHFSVNCMAPAVGRAFVARASVRKAGKRQVFAHAEVFAEADDGLRLVAAGEVILVPVA